jgi:hypothetical protein
VEEFHKGPFGSSVIKPTVDEGVAAVPEVVAVCVVETVETGLVFSAESDTGAAESTAGAANEAEARSRAMKQVEILIMLDIVVEAGSTTASESAT